MSFRGIEAVLFDMDGTLIDSEPLSEQVVLALLRSRGLPVPEGDLSRFHGVTWRAIADLVVAAHPELAGEPLHEELQAGYQAAFLESLPTEIPGAAAAVRAAAEGCPATIVTSSNRESVDLVVERLGIADTVGATVCAEDCQRSKPDPQPYQIAAERIGRAPDRCLVFEDSVAGLTSARAAGMWTVAITQHRSPDSMERVERVADLCVADYTRLPTDFFTTIRAGR